MEKPAATAVVLANVQQMTAWLGTNAGKQRVEESLSQSKASVQSLNEARTVDPKLLQEPVTV